MIVGLIIHSQEVDTFSLVCAISYTLMIVLGFVYGYLKKKELSYTPLECKISLCGKRNISFNVGIFIASLTVGFSTMKFTSSLQVPYTQVQKIVFYCLYGMIILLLIHTIIFIYKKNYKNL